MFITLVGALSGFSPLVEWLTPASGQLTAAGQSSFPPPEETTHPALRLELTRDARDTFIARAQLWRPTDIAGIDLRAGPQGTGAFAPNELVTCDYVTRPMHG